MAEGKERYESKRRKEARKKIRRYAIAGKGSREERESVEVTRVKEKGK